MISSDSEKRGSKATSNAPVDVARGRGECRKEENKGGFGLRLENWRGWRIRKEAVLWPRRP